VAVASPPAGGAEDRPGVATAPPAGEDDADLPPVSAPPPAALISRLDERSLVLGVVGGLAVGVALGAIARGGRLRARERAAAEPRPVPAAPPSAEPATEGAAPAAVAARPRSEPASRPEPGSQPASAPQPAPEFQSQAPPAPAASPTPAPPPPAAAAAAPPQPRPAASPPDLLAADVFALIQRLDDRCARSEATLAALLERTERLERRGAAQGEELRARRAPLARIHRALGRAPSAAPRAAVLPPVREDCPGAAGPLSARLHAPAGIARSIERSHPVGRIRFSASSAPECEPARPRAA